MSDASQVAPEVTISHSKPSLTPQEAEAVASVIATGHIAQGPVTESFERALAARIGRSHAIGTASGTAALHLVLLAMSIGPGDEVLIPSYVCTALLNAVHYVGASAVITDIDPATGNMDPVDANRRLTPNIRAIIVPHMFGCPASLNELMTLGVPVIEDCAQAVGAAVGHRPVGSFGRAAIFSFYATKMMTTGEGGMAVTDVTDLADRVWDLREYDKRPAYRLRYNYKMTDIQAAMGLVQLARLDEFIDRRRTLARDYRAVFNTQELRLPVADRGHIYYRFVLGVPGDPRAWFRRLADRGIDCARPVDAPLDRLLGRDDCPNARELWRRHLSIPIYPALTAMEQDRIVQEMLRYLGTNP